MPRFYFDTDGGERQFCDEHGIDLASVDDVPNEVLGLLRDLAHVHLLEGRRVMAVAVRNASGAVIYRMTMTLEGQHFG